MGQFQLNTDEMNSTANRLSSEADELRARLQSFSAAVTNLLAEGYRTPSSSQAFSDSWQEFQKGYNSVTDGLGGLGQFLKSAGDAFISTDQQLGSGLKQGG
jgi:WXG100 family type VII secretion target